jgi:hypothetical protein
VPPPVEPPPVEPDPLLPDPLPLVRELEDEGMEEELLLEDELVPGMSEEAVSRTWSTTRLITLRQRALLAAAAAPAAAPAAAAIAVRRVRVFAAFFPLAERFFEGALLRAAAFLAGRRLALAFFAGLREADLRDADLRAGADFFFELFLLDERLLELLFFDDFFEDFFEPFFDAIGSLLFNVSVGGP